MYAQKILKIMENIHKFNFGVGHDNFPGYEQIRVIFDSVETSFLIYSEGFRSFYVFYRSMPKLSNT